MMRFLLSLGLLFGASGVYGETLVTKEIPHCYFLKNTVVPEKGRTSRSGILRTQKEFDAFFGPAAVMFSDQKFLPEDYFKEHAVLFFAEWGNTPWEYQIVKTVRENGTIRVFYRKTGTPSPMAEYSPFFALGISRKFLTQKTRLEVREISQDR